MQALEAVDSDQEPNTVIKVMTNGYKLHEHLVRPAIVIVAKAKQDNKEENKQESDKLDA